MENNKEHKERRKASHKMLDELIADFIADTRKMPSETTIMELMKWCYKNGNK